MQKATTNPQIFSEVVGFDWDHANIQKNENKHQVTWQEAEEVFINQPIIVAEDTVHSKQETRWHVLGKTNKNRKLFLACTIRKKLIRVISARDQSQKERKIYDQT